MKILELSERNHFVILKDTYGLPVLVTSFAGRVPFFLSHFQASFNRVSSFAFRVPFFLSQASLNYAFSPFQIVFSSSLCSSLSAVLQHRSCYPAKMLL